MAEIADHLDVVGIGSMVVDRVHRASRILGPDEKGMLADLGGQGPVQYCVGGVVLNHLGWASVLGLRTGIFGRQADDDAGRFLRSAMDEMGIERDIAIEGDASSVAEIFIDELGQRAIYMARGTTEGTTAEQIRGRHAGFIRRASRLSTEISQLPLPAVLASLEVADAMGIPTVVDFDIPPSEALGSLGDEETLERILAKARILKPSKAAIQELFGTAVRDPLEMARKLRERFRNDAVVVTDGAAGCGISAAEFEGFVPGMPAKVVDTTGAGDAFLGGLLAGLEYELGWEETGRLANACGAACAEQLGAFPQDPELARTAILDFQQRGEVRRIEFRRRQEPKVEETLAGAGRRVLEVAAREVESLARRHDGRALEAAADLVEQTRQRGGRVHIAGVGKSEHVAHYGASLLSSTGTAATFLHVTEARHGSLGQVVEDDLVILISNSGQTPEILELADALESFTSRRIVITGNPESRLAELGDVVLDAGVAEEGGPLGLAPRASVANQVLVLGALGAVVQERCKFTKSDYAKRHPSGSLGERSRR